MTTPFVLLGFAALIAFGAGSPLSRAQWTSNAPRLAVAMWQALSFGVISAVILASAAIAGPALPQVITGPVSELLERCATALQSAFGEPNSALVAVAALLAGVAMSVRLAVVITAEARDVRRVRRAQHEQLRFTGRVVPGSSGETLVLIDDQRSAAYCLPRTGTSGQTIVVTTAAMDALDDDQIRLVLGHERAHLRQRHHVATLMVLAFARAFRWVPLFRHAATRVPRLLEMAADDHAVMSSVDRRDGRGAVRRQLAYALLALGSGPVMSPAGSLAAAGSSTAARVRRLTAPNARLGAVPAFMIMLGVAAAAAGPTLVATAPALCAAAMEICPIALA